MYVEKESVLPVCLSLGDRMNMKDWYICERKDTKYSCILCSNAICNVCAESAMYNEEGYDEDNYRVGKCPRGKCKKIDNVSDAPVAVKNNAVKLIGNVGGNTENSINKSNEKSEGKRSMQQSFRPFFSRSASRKRKNKDDTQRKSQDVADTVAEVPAKLAKGEEEERKSNFDEGKDNKEGAAPVIQSAFKDSSESAMCKSEIFAQFKKIFNDIDETQIHNYYFCTERNCNEICSDDLKTAKKR